MAGDLGDRTALVQEGCRGSAEVQWVGLGCAEGRVHKTCTRGQGWWRAGALGPGNKGREVKGFSFRMEAVTAVCRCWAS